MFIEESQAVILSFFFGKNREYIIRLNFYITTGDDQFAPGSADRYKNKVFYLEFTDFMANNRCTLFCNYFKDGSTRNRRELLELGVLGPVVEA